MTRPHRWLTLATCILLALPLTAMAQDSSSSDTDASDTGGWHGSGEFGFAMSRGNSHTENINAKLSLKQETARWKNSFYLTGLRSKGDVTIVDADTGESITQFSTTANRYELGASVGYKFDPRSYLVTALRYEHDDFGANRWQGIFSVGYGYILLKNKRTELSFEIGPGYKRYQPAYIIDVINGQRVKIKPPVEHEVVGRGLISWKWQFTDNTKLEDTLLVEAGSKNKYYQNDLGLSVSMTKKLALKLGYQVRYNSNAPIGTQSTDQLYTTNLVYNF
ncbi:MAG TPA: DUF481 domain-containing protein [Oleiagrimonas sp.]|nr:DUF481 domain-containing protein [Oleiagrimonas sp.]